jgi:CRISPR-associated endonuclease/helicase Cas3
LFFGLALLGPPTRRGLRADEVLTLPRNDRYDQFFASLSEDGFPPYDYQRRVAQVMWRRENVVLRAPTGTGKTLAVLGPFLFSRERIGATRLIYALPLRSLAQGIYREAREICTRLDSGLQVTMQTGEQPDDPFFTRGDIVVTTYDQVLSGLLCGPYGLSAGQHNVNAALVAGSIVVFDEFHLMEISRAFLAGIACLSLFSKVTRSVWMTATATAPLEAELRLSLNAVHEGPTDNEVEALYTAFKIQRRLRKHGAPLCASDVLDCAKRPTLVVVNQVKRAQALYKAVLDLGFPADRIELLHARFFQRDRDRKQRFLMEHFGKKPSEPAVAIATQVVEAGLDLSGEDLLTEVCPMNSLVQRAGRCARFRGQKGTVHVFPLSPEEARPYEPDEIKRTWDVMEDTDHLSPRKAAQWVEETHAVQDQREVEAHRARVRSGCVRQIMETVRRRGGGVAHLIRGPSDTVRMMLAKDPANRLPSTRETIPVYRSTLRGLIGSGASVWTFDPDFQTLWRPVEADLTNAYVVAVSPANTRYTEQLGLEIGIPGEAESPKRTAPKRPGYGLLEREHWTSHSRAVESEAKRRLELECIAGGLLEDGFGAEALSRSIHWASLFHDLGKLQDQWQRWAEAYQSRKEPGYRHAEALAHTTYDSASPEDRTLERETRPVRPTHAAASAYYTSMLPAFNANLSPEEQRSVLASILSHHGGWWSSRTEVGPAHAHWAGALQGLDLPATKLGLFSYVHSRRFQDRLEQLFDERFEINWPLTAYLIRVLRLSDRKATDEARSHE